ncbi:MAG: hypothetical protein AB1656_11335 [Candidatus Omnitrophota bacterium]
MKRTSFTIKSIFAIIILLATTSAMPGYACTNWPACCDFPDQLSVWVFKLPEWNLLAQSELGQTTVNVTANGIVTLHFDMGLYEIDGNLNCTCCGSCTQNGWIWTCSHGSVSVNNPNNYYTNMVFPGAGTYTVIAQYLGTTCSGGSCGNWPVMAQTMTIVINSLPVPTPTPA